jgi:ornithine carbamoyltransferase
MLHSLLLLGSYLGLNVDYAVPEGFEPNAFILKRAMKRAKEGGAAINGYQDPAKAAAKADVLYTDVWTSMGFEEESKDREQAFQNYQINEELYAKANPGAIVMHCLPMVRGKEITDAMADHPKAMLFQQAENRLHAQKALLLGMMAGANRKAEI